METKSFKGLILRQKLFVLFLFFVFYFLFSVGFAFAAEISIEAKNTEIRTGDEFQMDIFINTENQPVNALEGNITFPNDLLELSQINDSKSIIVFWVDKPRLDFNNQIIFSGIVPGGYNDKKGELLSLIFKTKKQGSGEISFNNMNVLANDGKGTSLDVKIPNFKFSISDQASSSTLISEPKDTEPPENFELTVTSSTNIFDGKWFIAFATQDKGTGIDHYEIKEQRRMRILNLEFGIWPTKWEIAESPYLLKDQELKSYIYVKAIDKAGNERIAMLAPKKPLSWYESPLVWIIIIIIILGLFFRRKILWKRQP